MIENKEYAASFYSKMNLVRKNILALDWKDDKFLSLGGRNGYNYLSIDKIKRNLAPILQGCNLDLGIEFCDLTQLNDPKGAIQHWTVRLKASLIDVETGYERVYTAYGESSDHADKGVNKAQTAAMKQFLSNTFMLIDGIDPDGENMERQGGFVPKAPAEVIVAKSKVLANAIKPTPAVEVAEPAANASEEAADEPVEANDVEEAPKAPAAPVKPAKAPAPKPKAPTAKPKPAAPKPKAPASKPKLKVTPAESPKLGDTKADMAEAPAEKPTLGAIVADAAYELEISTPHKNAIANILRVKTEQAARGEITPAEYNQMSVDFATIMDNATGTAFLNKYRVGTYE